MPTARTRAGNGTDRAIEMATIKLDIPAVVAEVPAGDAGWKGAPENSVIGHVHLRVGDPEAGREMVA